MRQFVRGGQTVQVPDWREAAGLFPCPDILWQGVWSEVADKTRRSWDVWAATYCALSALAERNLHWYYVGAPLFGMAYVLCVGPTGGNKQLPVDICETLVPENYNKRDGVQSGAGLFPMLVDTSSRAEVKPVRPTLMIMDEWTKLITNMTMQSSTLLDEINSLFHRNRRWNVSRSDREGGGGDRVSQAPILSIFGTTTPEALLSDVSELMVNRGMLNRYLVLPAATREFEYRPKKRMSDPTITLAPLRQELMARLTGYKWGGGESYEDAFSEEAMALNEAWGAPLFRDLMGQNTIEANRKKRLHMYAHHIALVSAWSKRASRVEVGDMEMAIAVIACANRFMDWLYTNDALPLTTVEVGDARLEQIVRERIADRPSYYDRGRLRESLRRQNIPLSKLRKVIDVLLSHGDIMVDPKTMKYMFKGKEESGNTTQAPSIPTSERRNPFARPEA